MTKMKQFDLRFGDPVLIRGRLKNLHTISDVNIGYRMDDECEKSIIKWVKSYYKKQFNIDYKHVILTHGANGGLDVVVRCTSTDVYFVNELAFAWYERVLRLNGARHIKVKDLEDEKGDWSSTYIVDSPNNPWGRQVLNPNLNPRDVVWDSVYASPAFVKGALAYPDHHVMVGSMSKIFGLSGLRIGWVGTNDDLLASRVYENTLTAYCGLSTPSLEIANTVLERTDFDQFQKVVKLHLDFARDDFNKLRNIFNLESPDNGMFYMGVLDSKNKEILNKSGVLGVEFNSMDGNQYLRLNMADDPDKTSKAIRAILKADKI
jgi:aspartate/methionine/tyrosine aminotransferase